MFSQHEMFAIYFLSTPAVQLAWPVSPASDQQIRQGTGDGVIPWTARVGMSNLSLKAKYINVLTVH